MDPITIGATINLITKIWDKYSAWKRAKEERAAEAAAIAAEVEIIYEATSGGIGDLSGLVAEWKAKVRTLKEILLPLRARIEIITEHVGVLHPNMDPGKRELIIAAVLARALHDVLNDDDVIPFVDDTEAIRLLIHGVADLWRAKRAADRASK